MLNVPSYNLSDVNVFNFRNFEWDETKIIDNVRKMFECASDYGITIQSISIEDKQKTKSVEIRKTISKMLKIVLVHHNSETNVDTEIPMEYEIPWLINNHFYIGGNYKVCIYQLYDKPVTCVKDMIKIRTTMQQSFTVEKRTNKRKTYNYEISMFMKKFPFAKLLLAAYGEEGLKDKFKLDDNFDIILNTEFDNKNENMKLLREDVIRLMKDTTINKNRIFSSDFPKSSDSQIIDNIRLCTKIDIFSARYMHGDIIEEFLYVLENGSYDDDDYANKRLRFIEQVVYCYIAKDIYNILSTIKKNRKMRFSINSKAIIQNANVSNIVQYDTSINPLYELAILSRTSLSGPGGFQKSNVPLHLREIHPSMLHLIDPSDTGDRDSCGTTQYVVPSAQFDEYGALSYKSEDDPINSISVSFVPCLEHDDPVRLQMSSSQQRHAVMLESFDLPLVQSGVEGMYSNYTSFACFAKDDGQVIYENNDIMIVKYQNGQFDTFHIGYRKLYISILDFFYVYYNVGHQFKKGDILAESNFMKNGKITLGKNIRTCITPWYGYNYEDAIIVSDRIRRDKVFCSVHYQEVVIDIPQNKVLINLTDDKDNYKVIPNIGDHLVRGQIIAKLKAIDTEKYSNVVFEPETEMTSDEDGEIIDIKVYANKWNSNFPQYDNFIKTKLKEKKQNVDSLISDVSKYLNEEETDRLINTLEINKSEKNNYKIKGDSVDGVRIEITVKYERNLQLGDKLANRHGNKGTISRFVPDELMPLNQEDGTRADIIINPLGIVSRMNIGQVFECHLGECVMNFKKHVEEMIEQGKTEKEIKDYLFGFIDIIDKTKDKNYTAQMHEIIDPLNMDSLKPLFDKFFIIQPPFESIGTEELKKAMDYTNSKYEVSVFDPVSNKKITSDLVFGWIYFMKLNHISQDKIAYRGIGPYSAKTSQPLGGKSRKGGQRLGEMEIWAVIGHGDEKNLNEFITTKSDSIRLRNKYISHCIGNDDLLSDTDDDTVPQSLRLLQNCLKSISVGFEMNEGDSRQLPSDLNEDDNDPIIDEILEDEDLDDMEDIENEDDAFDMREDE